MTVTGTRSVSISRSVHAGLQTIRAAVTICASLVNTQTDRQLLTSYTLAQLAN